MRKIISALGLTLLCTPLVHAEGPTLFGRFFVQTYYSDAEFDADSSSIVNAPDVGSADYSDDSVSMSTYKSYIGVRGSEPITDTTDVIYQLQFAVNMTDSSADSPDLPNRSNYLGLRNDTWGTLSAGRYWTPIDLINNVVVAKGFFDNNGTNSLSRDAKIVNALNMTDTVPRVSNVLFWTSPERENLPFELFLMYQTEEDKDNGEGFGTYLTYKPDNSLIASVAYDSDLEIDGSVLRGTATYDLAHISDVPVTLGALYQVADYDDISEKEEGMVLSAKLRLDNFSRPAAVYAQYNRTNDLNGVPGSDSNQIAFGGEYSLKDNVLAHAYIGYNKAKDVEGYIGTTTDINGITTPLYANGDSDVFAVGAGLEYKF